MNKKAVCIGIDDYPGERFDLNGCVNDARAWAEVLVKHFGFARSDITLINDEWATKAGILSAIDNLLLGVRAGDVRVFVYSGHGSWVPDREPIDEEDGRDEAIVPCEANFDNLITDDDLRARLDGIPGGVNFTVICDSCHSGTVTRLWPRKTRGNIRPLRRARFYPPPELSVQIPGHGKPLKHRLWSQSEERMPEILLSAASADEFAEETFLGGEARGAFSFYAVRILDVKGPDLTYAQWMSLILDALSDGEFSQTPQLEGRASYKARKVFAPFSDNSPLREGC